MNQVTNVSTTAAAALPRFLPASAPVYQREHKPAKWTRRITVAGCPCSDTAGRILRRELTGWSKAEHLSQADYHHARAARLDEVWAQVWRQSFKEAFGRIPVFGDYRITAIGREEIAEHHKRVLRHCAYQSTVHTHLARAHERAAGLRKLRERA